MRRLDERRVLGGKSARMSRYDTGEPMAAAGLRGSSVGRSVKSRDVQMTASDERVALRGICACTVRISEEEVSDFCSVLSLAGRVFVAGSADATTVAALFRLSLAEFGFDAHVLDTTTVRRVEPADTVVAIAGPQPDAALTAMVRIVVDTQAVLLAVATHRTALLLGQSDAAITVPWTAGTESMRKGSAEEVCDPMSLVTLHAIRRELTRRCSRDNPRGAPADDSLPPRRAPVGSDSTFDAQLEET
jgi:D-arabinose 5-phosphate isomerase GutQ